MVALDGNDLDTGQTRNNDPKGFRVYGVDKCDGVERVVYVRINREEKQTESSTS